MIDTNALILQVAEWMGVIAVVLLLGLSKGFRERVKLGFKYPRREAVISLSVFVLAFLAAILYAAGKLPVINPPANIPEALWPQLVVALAALVLFGIALFVRRQPIRSAGWGRNMLGASFRMGIALVFLAVFLRGAVYKLLDGVSTQEVFALLTWLVLALAEETVFRGYLQLRLDSFFGERYGWLASSLLFVLWQLPRLLATPGILWYRLVLAFAQALILGWTMRRSGHVLGVAMYRAVSEWISML